MAFHIFPINEVYSNADGSASGGLQLIATVLSQPVTPALIVPATDLFVIGTACARPCPPQHCRCCSSACRSARRD